MKREELDGSKVCSRIDSVAEAGMRHAARGLRRIGGRSSSLAGHQVRESTSEAEPSAAKPGHQWRPTQQSSERKPRAARWDKSVEGASGLEGVPLLRGHDERVLAMLEGLVSAEQQGRATGSVIEHGTWLVEGRQSLSELKFGGLWATGLPDRVR